MEIKRIGEHGYDACLTAAAAYLGSGKVVCFPTETFYALGACYDRKEALQRIARLKGRETSKAFSLIIGRREDLSLIVSEMDFLARRIIDNLWPAALTVVFKAREGLYHYIRDERNTVAVRMPAPSFALDLVRKLGIPVTATSANQSGMPPARNAEEVMNYFREGIDLLIDGGMRSVSLPSTIIEIRKGEVKILREGAVSKAEVFSLI